MAESSRIVPIGTAPLETLEDAPLAPADGEDVLTLTEAEPEQFADEDYAPPRAWGPLLLRLAAVAAVLAWTGLFGWTNRAALGAGGTPEQWVQWLVQWSTPTLLVAVAWLIAMRNSTREAARFGATARMLGDESARLEGRLLTVNRELSLAREFIAAQARDIDSLGRVATERLTQHADHLASLIGDNGERVETIGRVSETALENMEKLRGQLPVIASSAKDVTNNIGNAGRTAHGQIEALVTAFNRLNEFGAASELKVQDVQASVDAALRAFAAQTEQLDTLAQQRFAALKEQSEALRSQIDRNEVDALTAIRSRTTALAEELGLAREALAAQESEGLVALRSRLEAVREESSEITTLLRSGEEQALAAWTDAVTRLESDLEGAIARVTELDRQALEAAQTRLRELATEAETVDARLAERDRLFAAEMQRRHADVAMREAAALNSLSDQLAAFDARVAERRTEQELQSQRLVAHGETIAAQLAGFAARMTEIAEHGGAAEAGVAASLARLADHLAESREALGGTDRVIAELTDGSVRLLELIRASVQHSREDLPRAIAEGEARLEGVEQRALLLQDTVRSVEGAGKSLSDYVMTTREEAEATRRELDALHSGFGEQSAEQARHLADLRLALTAARKDSEALAQHAQGELHVAISALAQAARDAVANIETMSGQAVTALAGRLGDAAGEAIDQAMRARAAEVTGQLEAATAHATGVSREAAVQLRDQLARINELAGNLEQRVERARRRAEEQVDADFARRVALISEALNSNAIDIAKAISADVADTAWAAYLRGDRGVFTRRAVRLLDAGEAKAVAQVYEGDRDFREHVSRYIHDFEAMLRQLLSTRDGHALGVTLLSSDMGKLYVALAQSIERFRE